MIANEDENTKKGESLFNTSWPLIGYSTDREGIARFSLRRKVRSALIIVNQTSGRRTVSAEEAPSCASTIIVEIGENIGAEEQGGRPNGASRICEGTAIVKYRPIGLRSSES